MIRFINGTWQHGTWSWRVGPYIVQFKAPWSLVLFSERCGFRRCYPHHGWRFRAWRIGA